MKTYSVEVTYQGEIEAKSKEELEEALFVAIALFGKPFTDDTFEAVDWTIEGDEEE
tara:strand:- start:4267 stop:4434 length:168 start_codon:yes stop_codon:yes gene_type:complete